MLQRQITAGFLIINIDYIFDYQKNISLMGIIEHQYFEVLDYWLSFLL